MNEAVGHIGEVVKREGIDCDFRHGGYLSVARNRAQLARVHSSVAELRSWGFGAEHVQELSAPEVAERVRMSDALGGLFSPNCAAVHPAKLVRGLAECVERRGVKIYERTRATTIAPRVVATDRGTVHADVVIRATEGYTADLEGAHRDIVPMYSLMVATQPLNPVLGLGSAGGYVGDGVSTAEVAGRTLAHLVSGEPSELTSLPWVRHDSPRWEPEPLRWVGVNAVTALFATADVTERRTGGPSRAAKTFWRAIGH